MNDPTDLDNNPNDVDYSFDNCIFQNTGIAVELDVPYAQSDAFIFGNVNLEFRNTVFTNCQALQADISYITLFENCTLTNANIEVAHTYWLNVKNTTIRSGGAYSSSFGIKTSHVGHFWFRENSLIDGWGTGIDASAGINWNIIMTGSTVQKCVTGIAQNGFYNSTLEVGLLHMDCARLIQNDAGIVGQDIIFSAYARPGNTNIFTRSMGNPTGLFIETVFKDRQNRDTELWFHGNYWDGTTPLTTPINDTWSFRIKTGAPQPPLQYTPWVGTIHISTNSYPVQTDPNALIVQNCGGILPRSVQEDPLAQNTIVNINGILYDVKIQQDAGMSLLSQNNLADAQNVLNPVAEIPRLIVDTASASVRHFVSVSRALTLQNGVQARSKSNNGWLPEAIVGIAKLENMLVLSPNPANEQFDISLPQGNYDIKVFDALGKLVYSKNTEGVTNIDVRTWQNGLYMVSLLDKNSKKKTFSKVVVQH